MFKTLRIAFQLRIIYKVNAVIHVFRGLPLIGKHLPVDLYRNPVLKILGMVIALGWELMVAFLGKLLYFLVMIFLASGFYETLGADVLFGHFLVFLTMAGATTDTYFFHSDEPAYYAVLLLGMDAREYTIVRYGYAMAKYAVGFLLFGLIFGLLMGAPLGICLLAALYVVGVKTVYCSLSVRKFEKKGEAKFRFGLPILIAELLCAYGLPAIGIALPVWASGAVMAAGILLGALSLRKILTFRDYRIVHQHMYREHLELEEEIDGAETAQTQKQIVADGSFTSNRRGFAYLNDLFFKRHRKLFWHTALYIAAAAAALAAGICLLLYLVPEMAQSVNVILMSLLPSFALVMYAINRGISFTKTLFINCDHSLLTYGFYKEPRSVLKLFWLRLIQIIRVNLLPAAVIAAGLPAILYFSGGTENALDYVVLPVTILALSVFFSIHYLTLYYLLQPFTAGSEMKSGAYQLTTGLTYYLCFILTDVELPTLVFGSIAIGFCAIYCVAACVLVYFLAPKTFRLRA